MWTFSLTLLAVASYPGITFSDRPVVGGLFSLLALASAPAAPASAVAAAAAAAVGNVTV
jgi:hypothetical protein